MGVQPLKKKDSCSSTDSDPFHIFVEEGETDNFSNCDSRLPTVNSRYKHTRYTYKAYEGGPAILYSHIFVTKIFIYLFGLVISYIYIYKFQSLYLHTTLGGTARWYKYDTMHQCSTRISIKNPEICKHLGLFMQGRGGVIFCHRAVYAYNGSITT